MLSRRREKKEKDPHNGFDLILGRKDPVLTGLRLAQASGTDWPEASPSLPLLYHHCLDVGETVAVAECIALGAFFQVFFEKTTSMMMLLKAL